jgi:pimeloyl-[acyl-carrier protein] methyl ester esterase
MKELVFVHGWGFGSRVWEPVAERLADSFEVHCVDLPGYGAAAVAAETIVVCPLFSAVATVCAWSLGAFEALEWAARWPDRVARLVLVGATPRFLQAPGWSCAQPPELLAGFAAGIAGDPAGTLRRFAALINQGDAQARTATRALTSLLDDGIAAAAVLSAGLDRLADTDLRALVPTVAQPTLVVHGEHDPLMPLAAARWLAGHLPQGRLEVFAGAAHAPFLSQPERFADLLAAFIHES